MQIIRSEGEYTGTACAVALGMFDGVHIGHQALIRAAVRLARENGLDAVVCTFDKNPLEVICPEKAPKPLLSLEENMRKFELLGADVTLVKAFTQAFADTDAEDYIQSLVGEMRVRFIVVGENYTFGKFGRGNAATIRDLAQKFGYGAVVVKPVSDGEGVVSSTRIRQMLISGETAQAKKLLDITEGKV